jgi:hypothetical protein
MSFTVHGENFVGHAGVTGGYAALEVDIDSASKSFGIETQAKVDRNVGHEINASV